MKQLYGLAIIFGSLFFGQILSLLIPIKIPGPIYGMIILLVLLLTRRITLSEVEGVSNILIANMLLFFIPGGVNLLSVYDILQGHILVLIVICILTTVITLGVTSWVTELCINYFEKERVERVKPSMNELFYNPVFGVTITIFALFFFQRIFQGRKNPLLNPMVFSIIAIIFFLKVFQIPVEAYQEGGSIIAFLLGPVTVALAVPLYRQRHLLKKYVIPIFIGVSVGSFTGIASVLILGKLFSLSDLFLLSLAPKSTTAAIAMELSQAFGGNPTLTIAFVTISGTTGFLLGEFVLKILRIKNPTAKGIGMGTASHAFGTNKALEMGEEEGAMSSLAIGLAGIITTLLMPICLALFHLI